MPILPVEIYGRLISIIFSLIIISSIYYLSLYEHSRTAAVAGAVVYAVFPFFVFFSRVVLPESTAVGLMFLSIVTLYQYLNIKKYNSKVMLFVSIFFYATSILVKPTTIFYSFVLAYLFIRMYKFDVFKTWKPYIFVFLGIIPLFLWRVYISNFPEGIPASSWLITTVNTFEGAKNIFFRPAFFRWIFMERLGIAILGIYMSFFFILGLISKYKSFFLYSVVISIFSFLFTFQGGNVQHEYYQTIVLPGVALILGFGVGQLVLHIGANINRAISYPMILIIFVLSFFVSWYKVKDYYYFPQDLPHIAKIIQAFTNSQDRIVTDRSGDTTLLYLADRKGAPAIYKDVTELKQLGYSYLVTADLKMANQLKDSGYVILVQSDLFSLIKL